LIRTNTPDHTWHPCAPESVWVRDPAGVETWPRGLARKLGVVCCDGVPISAQVRFGNGYHTVLPIEWLTDPPRFDDVVAAARGNVIPFPVHRTRRRCVGADWTQPPEPA
jgi:hypothetical protein